MSDESAREERDSAGRFAVGNAGGPGRTPGQSRAQALRVEMQEAVAPNELRTIMRKLIEKAKTGSLPHAREVLDRLLGKPVAADLETRIEEAERLVAQLGDRAEGGNGV